MTEDDVSGIAACLLTDKSAENLFQYEKGLFEDDLGRCVRPVRSVLGFLRRLRSDPEELLHRLATVPWGLKPAQEGKPGGGSWWG